MKQATGVKKYLGVFLIALSLLMLEVALTRIFSVILYYHFAVLSISLALFGSAAAGVLIYLFPAFFEKWDLETVLSLAALAYSITVVICFAIILQMPIITDEVSVNGFLSLALVYLVLAVPFFFGGVCLSFAMTKLSANVSLIYFADLIGAALGCLLALALLDMLGGPGTIIAASLAGAFSALTFGFRLRLRFWNLAWLLATLVFLILNAQFNTLRIVYVKGRVEADKLYEKWNSFSRVAVFPENAKSTVFGWGLSRECVYDNPGWMRLNIDGMAETPILRYNGDMETLSFLKCDVSSLVYNLRNNARVLIIGPGGGRDVLTALMFGNRQVDGVELNPSIVNVVRHVFADYAGHIYADPRVSIAVDDGRNFVAKSTQHYDVIQASAVDTWAATAAGAFALSENTLYTREAFLTYRQHLTPDGILAFSRFVYPGDRFGEALRLVSLGLAAWQADGVDDPRQYLMMVGQLDKAGETGFVSLLLKNSPFTLHEVEKIEKVNKELGFVMLYAPFGRGQGVVRDLVMAEDYTIFWQNYPIDITPTTDDRPFFFQMLKLTDIPRYGLGAIFNSEEKLRVVPIATLATLLVTVTALVLVFVLGPMWLFHRENLNLARRKNLLFLAYFTCLGIGFMMVEVGLIQKFMLFLGHPTYSLAVVLTSLLLSSGLGSFLTRKIEPPHAAGTASRTGLGLMVLLQLYIIFLPILLGSFMGLNQWIKVIISIFGLFPMGLLMGVFFPSGIKLLTSRHAEPLIPWCWAVNGASSVFASVFAIAVGIQFGMRAELVAGGLCYLTATGILLAFARKAQPG